MAAAALLLPASACAQESGWSLELYGGSAYSVPTSLTIRQQGEPDITLTARYATRPWEDSPYYAYRFGRWSRGRAWELELIHHKLYLDNPSAGVQHFELSHGYNLLCVNRAVQRGGVILRLGVGVVIAYPHGITVRQRLLPNRGGIFGRGYHLSGPTAQLAGTKRFAIWKKLFLGAEGKLTGTYARVPLHGGSATAPNVAIHGLLGLGYTFE